MFIFNKKTPNTLKIEYKPKLEPFMSSYLKSNINTRINPKIENINATTWSRVEFEKSREDNNDFFSFPHKEKDSLVSSISKEDKNDKNDPLLAVVSIKVIYHLGSFIGKWALKQIRSTGFLNWFHPWIINRHSHFYRN
jgi:hypothetical protein